MVNHMHKSIFFGVTLLASCFCLIASNTTAAETIAASKNKVAPLNVLMVTGGSSHDYDNQKGILEKGIAARANVQWKIGRASCRERV